MIQVRETRDLAWGKSKYTWKKLPAQKKIYNVLNQLSIYDYQYLNIKLILC